MGKPLSEETALCTSLSTVCFEVYRDHAAGLSFDPALLHAYDPLEKSFVYVKKQLNKTKKSAV
jgi:hypothetical protein